MEIELLETEFKKISGESIDDQRKQMIMFLQQQGWWNVEDLEHLINKLETSANKKDYLNSIELGLVYPSILLVASIVMTILSVCSIDDLKWFSGCMAIVAVIMLLVGKCMRSKALRFDLIDLLQDLQYGLLKGNW